MSVFGKLREMVGWVLGEDLSAPDEPSQPRPRAAPAKQVQRRSDGDGFDDVRPAPRVTSPPRREVSAPVDAPTPDVAVSGSFVASLDDLHDFPEGEAEPEPEFVPEGGMSTQSLMREFETLDPELQAAAVEQAARTAAEAEAAGPAETSTQALISEVDALASVEPPHRAAESAAAIEQVAPSVAPKAEAAGPAETSTQVPISEVGALASAEPQHHAPEMAPERTREAVLTENPVPTPELAPHPESEASALAATQRGETIELAAAAAGGSVDPIGR